MIELCIGIIGITYGLIAGMLSVHKKRLRLMLFLPVVLLAVYLIFALGIIMAKDFRLLFPCAIQFWGSMLIGYAIIAAAAIATGWILIEGIRLKRRDYLLISGVFVVGIPIVYGKIFATDYDALSPAPVQASFVLQSTGYSCSAASVANLSSLFQLPLSERAAAERMRLNHFGGSVYQIAYALGKSGFTSTELDGKDISEVRFPAILIVDYGGVSDSHAILVKDRQGDAFEIVDPLIGSLTLRNRQWFQENWNGLGVEAIAQQ